MMKSIVRRVMFGLLLLGLSGWGARAEADEIHSAIYVLTDTSGSMVMTPDGTPTYGDGSAEHPHMVPADVSRLYMAKEALTTVVYAYGEVRWGLARFRQNIGENYFCMCHDDPGNSPLAPCSAGTPGLDDEQNAGGAPVCMQCDMSAPYPDYDLPGTDDRVCINYAGGIYAGCTDPHTAAVLDGADILVALAEDNEDRILMWIDHQETAFASGTDPATGDHCFSAGVMQDCELRGVGGTPIGGSLQDLHTQLSTVDIGNDPLRGCRPYSIIVLTDGANSCATAPTTWAANLRATPDMLNTCVVPADCPPGATCDTVSYAPGRCVYDVKTYVIGFALTAIEFHQANAIANAGGTGTAIPAADQDEIASAMAEIIAESIKPELCNGVDDDCDGDIDEDFPIGQACNNGLPGVCYGTGTYVCDPGDPTAVICEILPAPPAPDDLTEVCNGLDDDCDGEVDEGNVCTCNGPELCNGFDDYCDGYLTAADGDEDPDVNQACGTDVGACTAGLTVCIAGTIQCNGTGPFVEVCDADIPANDQNCNGVNNDGIAPQPCSTTNAFGTCDGLRTCAVDGTWTCWAADPAAESCNNNDDDCDGSIDENLSQPCQNTNAFGTCTGTETCAAGAWVGCTAATPVAEECNNADDNCDGSIDEGLSQPCQKTNAFGTCFGTETCAAGAWVGCTAATPADEICNNADDDCDGSIDEGVNQPCYSGPGGTEGVGPCTGGTQTCTTGTWGSCVGEVTPTTDVCDGVDNDCDGSTDEGLGQTTCGQGICVNTVDNCVGGVPQICDPFLGATTETCNGADDDCNGVIDGLTESCYQFGTGCVFAAGAWTCTGVCNTGTRSCPVGSGTWGACQGATGPSGEVCDNQDNDCDGSIDENLTEACYPAGYGPNTGCTAPGVCQGACVEGSRTCTAGAWGACGGATTPIAETCNNVDDDCDGTVDEGLTQPCQNTNAFGTCTGVETCSAGTWGACNAATPEDEDCDGVDDDCDGAIDENLTQPCQITNMWGTCTGSETCSAGAWIGCTAVPAAEEICNNADDDCDGSIDENLTQTCYNGPVGTDGVGICHVGSRTCTTGSWGTCVGEQTPLVEVCDNADNDCDGQTDEGLGQTTCGQGICQNTVQNCVGGVSQTCDPLLGQQAETCNGTDDDCDGVIDGLTQSCYSYGAGCAFAGGVWTCQGLCATGTQTCPAGGGGAWSGCQFDIGPVAEVCDGQDNNCDGAVDENLSQACYPLGYGPTTGCTAPGACLGVCQEGSRTCAGGAWGVCSGAMTPSVELCDNLDNDCDGQTDEGLSQACQVTNALGTCTGVETCAAGSWTGCTAATPAIEDCDNIDNDCDGDVDENVTQTCYTGPAGTEGVVACHGGTATCTAGTWGSCQGEATPSAEVCDGIDNDCDGQTDEDAGGNPLTEACYSGPAATEGVGVCIGGTRTCTGGSWSTCVGEIPPTAEQCNGADDDCDGQIDEDLGTTSCGLGVCQHVIDNCVAGVPQTCDPYQGAQPEICDGVDNDCDGLVDGIAHTCYEFATGCAETTPGVWNCEGACAPGLQLCPAGGAGVWGECQYDVGPSPEVCDNIDNDCDGQTDEDAAGQPLSDICYPPGSGPTTGCTWDASALGWDCLGLCTAGARECLSGVWGSCSGHVTPTVEVCDGSDNDCDGQIDEEEDIPGLNQPCGTALGRCTPGILRCIDSQEVCEGGDGPFEGVCNGQDDDCDGEIDEVDEVADEEGLTCGDATGLCEPGLTQCVGGAIQCVGGVNPTEEVCDGEDNDCDGDVDNQAECPPSSWCIEGDCRLVCDPTSEFPCPGTMQCVERTHEEDLVYVCMQVGGSCGGITCPDGWICENDQCVDPCDPNPCAWYEECNLGACLDTSCTGIGQQCDPGEFCLDHECVENPCLAADCDAATEHCIADCPSATDCTYTCQPLCLCGPGETCGPGGVCESDLCAGATCLGGQMCDPATGDCVPDDCFLVNCPGGEICHGGVCAPDPCLNTECPLGFHCDAVFTEDATAPVCIPDDGVWTPGETGEKFLATGGGGCACDQTDPTGGLGNVLWILGCLGLLWAWRRRRPLSRLFGLGALVLSLGLLGGAGCKLDPWQQSSDGALAIPDAGPDTATPDAEPDACVVTEEVCDGLDNDCDGVVDNGYDLATDPYNCGACGTICEFDYAFATCDASQCAMGTCLPGHWDVNGDPADGCEYACHETNDGSEVCDSVDNDCDGQIDEDFDLLTDPNNCGLCHRTCAFFNGVGSCSGGNCELDSCRGGHVDKDGNPNNGCECQMGLVEGTVACVEGGPATCDASEVCADVSGDGSAFCATIPADGCDGVDNDCDGQTDEDAASLLSNAACYTHPVGCTADASGIYTCLGLCQTGIPTCAGGEVVCGAQTGPAAELCDDLDNDCNGVVDDGFDKLSDPANCGGCGVQCSAIVTNGIPGCAGGACVVLACLPGFWDLNNDPTDGCEYACSYTNGGVEACGDSIDNDCDGQTDEGFDFTNDPANCGTCGNDCSSNVPFGTSVTGCVASTCTYHCEPNHYDLNGDVGLGQAGNGCEYACTVTNGGTEACDGVDNNCDGTADEGFDKQTDVANCGSCNYACVDHVGASSVVAGCANGVCLFACVGGFADLNGDVGLGASGDGCECQVTNGGVEICDNIDNDCDGSTDEDAGGGPLSQACYTGPGGTENVGPCHGGTQTCAAGVWNPCQGDVLPAVEVCDNVDNDCDGATDEDGGGNPLSQACYTGPPGTENVGPCHGGSQACSGGAWGVCSGEITPIIESCDSQDNDCDGSADEDFDTLTDINNCGVCGWSCAGHAGAFSQTTGCVAGSCQYICQSNHYDLNGNVNQGDAADGCEYACMLTNGGVEACGDSVDNDCDGQTDEGFDFTSDPANCGACGYSCAAHTPFGATATGCAASTCQYVCQANYHDLDSDLGLGDTGNGCEYACTVSGGGVETCDNLDNDCDGAVDDGFDKQTDTANCGTCGYVCAAHAGAGSSATDCANGVCQFACDAGHVDLDGDVSLGNLGTGCEYACAPSGAEVCDGNDNDCDGLTDEAGGGGPLTQACYTGPGGTEGVGPCHGGTQTCTAGTWGVCAGEITPQPETCDNIDNDCDAATDEAGGGGPLTQACYTGPGGTQGVGLCTGGTQSCTAGAWGACVGEVTPQIDVCDTQDNDCDTFTDEDFDTQTDITNCGSCGYSCVAHVGAHSYTTGCVGGTCQFACQANFYDNNGDIGLGDGGDGCEYGCTITNGGVEACGDGIDNDCDGATDEGFDLTGDPANCGACGYSCAAHTPAGAITTGCSASACQFVCQPNRYDIDGDLALGDAGNGCEYACTTSGAEICDDLDNDCDGVIDDGFDKQNDPVHCGACNYVCAAHTGANSTASGCSAGVCQFTCTVDHYDLNGDVSLGSGGDGCEYGCTFSGAEVCDNTDNDCDGATDEDAGGAPLTQACYTGPGGTEGVGLCHGGTQTCSLGAWGSCAGEVVPGSELCDSQDNDCDTLTDEDFDLTSDLNNCGACNTSCWASVPANAYPDACNAGTCHFACLTGFSDVDGDLNTTGLTGCEYTCPVSPPTTEYCDGLDNDCDGSVDEGLTPPVGFCNQGQPGSPCDGVGSICEDPDGAGGLPHSWYCQYPASVETDPMNPNQLIGYETLCDGLDGDCDGFPDDNFGIGDTCDNGLQGACRVTGAVICDAGDPSTTLCNLPPPATWPTPTDEVCDAADNDCDGLTDENEWQNNPANDPPFLQGWVVDDLVTVNVGGVTTYVYEYEASRPSADVAQAGTGSDARACSRLNVIPWANVTYEQAANACARAGMRLCGDLEWSEGCNGGGGGFPYGGTYDPNACNGHDQDPAVDAVEPTGTQVDCDSPAGGADMSGNLREWTADIMGYTSGGESIYTLRGGSFTDYEGGLACDFDSSGFVEDVFAPNVGFRCCTTCGNGTIDPGETCDPAPPASSPNCNPVHCGPDTCGDGVPDAGEQCDDGNLLPLDGCSPQCQFEAENCSSNYPGDEDGDGLANCADPDCVSTWCDDMQDNDGDGFTEANGDCCDSGLEPACNGQPPASIHPAAQEICGNGFDDNCNGFVDNGEPDNDGDGALPCVAGVTYDCDDWDPDRSPTHLEDPSDGKDNDCDGAIDEAPTPCGACASEAQYPAAMDICGWWLVSAMSQIEPTSNAQGHGCRSLLGNSTIGPLLGSEFLVLSSGHVDASEGLGGGFPYVESGVDFSNGLMSDPVEGGASFPVRDQVQYHLVLDVPTNVYSLSFDFVFFSAEYPEYVCTNFNDEFYAVIQSMHSDYAAFTCNGVVPAHPGGAPGGTQCRNISFDGNGNKISVNAAFFDNTNDAGAWSYRLGPNLPGTGYEDWDGNANNCWGTLAGCVRPTYNCPDTVGSSTAWLTTTANVVPGERIRILFDIHDESDGIYDSRVIIDNFRWGFTSVSGPVTTK